MRYSKLFIPTLKETPHDAQVVSHRLMLRSGMIRKVSAGIYIYLPLGWKVLQKISQIVREELNSCGAQELQMPMVQPAELWEESGRWAQYGPELLRFKDRKDTSFCLGPTHEEIITDLIRNHVSSYRQLPINLYQIQTKFRDEIRPRFGLMRGREFLMKDAYSFSSDQEGALAIYADMQKAYHRIFQRCGLKFAMVDADTGTIGGDRSHEFQVLADTGEDEIAVCSQCQTGKNVELADGKQCGICQTEYIYKRGIEVGHIFYLGTKYSKALNAKIVDEKGANTFIEMGCYGIGVGRCAAAAIEQNHDENGAVWPISIAPFEVACIKIGDSPIVEAACEELYAGLVSHNVDVLYDDRNERPGIKFMDHDLLGCPFRIMIGSRSAERGVVEIKERADLTAEAKIMPINEAVLYIKNRIEEEKGKLTSI